MPGYKGKSGNNGTNGLGGRIRELRKRLKLSQEEFGKPFAISLHGVSHWELGKVASAPVALIAANFKCSEEWLRTGHGKMFDGREKSSEIIGPLYPTTETVTNIRKMQLVDGADPGGAAISGRGAVKQDAAPPAIPPDDVMDAIVDDAPYMVIRPERPAHEGITLRIDGFDYQMLAGLIVEQLVQRMRTKTITFDIGG